MPLRFAFCTDDTLVDAELHAAIDRLAERGWDGVAVGFDPGGHLDPKAPDLTRRVEGLARHLERRGLACAVSLAPLDDLASPDSEARAAAVGVLCTAAEVAGALGAEAIAFGPGPGPGHAPVDGDRADAWSWLLDGCEQVVEVADDAGIEACLEPVPGSLVPAAPAWATLHDDIPALRLGLDLGACLLAGGEDPATTVNRWAPHLGAVAASDVDRRTAATVPLGHGELELHRAVAALNAVGYAHLVRVRLPLDGDRSPDAATAALQALKAAELSIQVGH
jgi:ribosomal protein S12 methylthiotransferase accessory factor